MNETSIEAKCGGCAACCFFPFPIMVFQLGPWNLLLGVLKMVLNVCDRKLRNGGRVGPQVRGVTSWQKFVLVVIRLSILTHSPFCSEEFCLEKQKCFLSLENTSYLSLTGSCLKISWGLIPFQSWVPLEVAVKDGLRITGVWVIFKSRKPCQSTGEHGISP